MKARKLRNVIMVEDNAYMCTVEVYNEKENVWAQIPYVAREGDDSPLNLWILNQLSTGKNKIIDRRVQ